MRKRQPINAEVPVTKSAPAVQGGEAKADAQPAQSGKAKASGQPAQRDEAKASGQAAQSGRAEAAPSPVRKRPRQATPLAPKLLAVAVALAVVFIVVAIVGGTGGEEDAGPGPTAGGAGGGGNAAQASEELGFPAFATSNTTRVGGDPVANAAAVALAVFPSTGEGQRPKAVTLVEEGSWPAALAASVLMAAPINAPLLISGEDPQEPTTQALDALDPSGIEGRGTQAFAIGDVAIPDGLEAARVRNRGPAATAAAIAKLRDRLFGDPPEHIVVASSSRPAFAMPAAAWAARSGDPLLFSGRARLPKATAAYIERHAGAPVYVLGPNTAISKSALEEIGAIAKRVRRIAGTGPVANSVAFARYRDSGFGWGIVDPGHGFVVARDDSPLDAAAASPLSASGTWGPLLLSDDAATLPAVLRDYLLDVKPGYTDNPTRAFYNHVWIIGDQEAIEVAQQGEIDELAELAKIGEGP